MPEHQQYCVVHHEKGITIVEPSRQDVLDAVYIESLGNEIYDVIRNEAVPRLIVDFKRVRMLSSAALGMLVALNKVVIKREGAMCLANVNEEVYALFKMTKFHKAVKILDSTEAAVDSLTT